MPGLSKELQEKLKKHKPGTIAQASLIPGITPAALSLLIFKVKEHNQNLAYTQKKQDKDSQKPYSM